MVLTNKEKLKRRKEKLKADAELKQKYLKKERERDANRRQQRRDQLSKKDLKAFRKNESDRVKAYYHKKKQHTQNMLEDELPSTSTEAENSHCSPFGSRQSFGKAFKRAESHLPNSPRKKLAIVKKISATIGLEVKENKSKVIVSTSNDDLLDSVTKFYMSDDVTWQAPGRKDRYIYREKDVRTGRVNKSYVQTRYLLMSLGEAYNLFCVNHRNEKIGLTKFSTLRPKHCKLFEKLPHNVCVCENHENIRLLLTGLRIHNQDLKSDFEGFINQVTCDSSLEDCMSMRCPNCASNINNFAPNFVNNQTLLKYFQWQNTDGRVEKVQIISTVHDAFSVLKSKLEKFLIHTFVKRKQSAEFQFKKQNVDGEKILLQVDFSENASLIEQNEIQSAHWNHKQATLFVYYAWITKEEEQGIVLVSDCLDHSKLSIYKYVDVILSYLKKKYPCINEVDIFSDGTAAQFKQRYLFANLHHFEQKYVVKMVWNFFATSHGKGIVDGIGGTVKRSVWRQVRSGKTTACSAKNFADVAAVRNTKLYVKFISEGEIKENENMLSNLWSNISAIPNCRSIHCVRALSYDILQVSNISRSSALVNVKIRSDVDDSDDDENISEFPKYGVNDWVLVIYDMIKFPGFVSKVAASEVEVSVMHVSKTGAYYKWPEEEDKIFYPLENVIKKIAPPTVVGARGQFSFIDKF